MGPVILAEKGREETPGGSRYAAMIFGTGTFFYPRFESLGIQVIRCQYNRYRVKCQEAIQLDFVRDDINSQNFTVNIQIQTIIYPPVIIGRTAGFYTHRRLRRQLLR